MNDAPINVKAIRERFGWSQEQLSAELGVDRSTVSRIETGVQPPSGPVLILLQQLAQRALSLDAGDEAAVAYSPGHASETTGE